MSERVTLVLHNFFGSSTSTRLRIALNLKGLDYRYVPYVLRSGETRTAAFLTLNPQGLVPVLELGNGTVLTQSLAIIEWLEETWREPPLRPRDTESRARVRALAYMIACEIHPLNNLRALSYLSERFGLDPASQKEWFIHWVRATFDALETTLARDSQSGTFCHGKAPTIADICLYSQVWNNRRFDIDTATWPTIAAIFDQREALPQFRTASPPYQTDAS